jgi:plasmid stability protein
MATVMVDLPDETHRGLKAAADRRGVTVDQLIREMSEAAVASFEAETQFREMAARGDPKLGLDILDELDRLDAEPR